MAISRTTLWIAGAVLVVPSLCLVGLAFVGRAIEDAQPALARDPSPEERAAQAAAREEARRAWLAMSPAQHLDAARRALAERYDPATGRGGRIHLALAHLDAIDADAGLSAEAETLRAEIRTRQTRLLAFAVLALRDERGEAPAGAAGHSLRCAMFGRVRERVGAPVISPGTPFDTGLVVNTSGCDEAALRSVLDARETLQRMHFERVECRGGGHVIAVNEPR